MQPYGRGSRRLIRMWLHSITYVTNQERRHDHDTDTLRYHVAAAAARRRARCRGHRTVHAGAVAPFHRGADGGRAG